MLKIGLTGGIGSGKSLVCQVFKELNVPVYHADIEARKIMEKVSSVISDIENEFGKKAYIKGKLNSSYIGEIVFSDRKKLMKLNSIVHPFVHEDFLNWSDQYSSGNYVIEEAAILFESGGAGNMDYTIFIRAEQETRIERVMRRDNLSREMVLRRIQSQMDDNEKEKLADFIIYNEIGSMILPQIVDLHNNFLKLNP